MVVTPVEQGDPHAPASQRTGGIQPAKAAPHHHDVREVRHASGTATGAKQERPEPRGPGRLLAHRYVRVFWRTNACTRFQASVEASANSVCFRSKKLCGAPG